MEEIWKDVVGYEGRYKVSNFGNVFSLKRQKVLAACLDRDGYPQVILCKNGVRKTCKVHQLEMSAFVGSRPEGYQVDHIDRNRVNNRLENLRYVTPSENQKNKVYYNSFGKRRSVNQLDLNGNLVATYISVCEAGRQTNILTTNICAVCRGKQHSAGGYLWEYTDGHKS